MSWISEKVKRILFIVVGTILLGIGGFGVLLPIVPTTPFLLLAAACYARGSKRIHRWMLRNRVFGAFIRNYVERKGITPRQKIVTLGFLWVTMTFTIVYVVDSLILRLFLVLIALAVSVHILKLPTLMSAS
jgi:uncharacterized membrane protein YbaN (DUF454 family)